MAKSPKPEGTESQPRFKKSKQEVRAKLPEGPFDRLRRLSNADAHYRHSEEFQRQAGAERNDRGAAILLAANVENALESTLAQVLKPEKVTKAIYLKGSSGGFLWEDTDGIFSGNLWQ